MPKRLSEDALDYFRKQGARGGKSGGAKSWWASLTPAQRNARTTKASQAAAVARSKKKRAKGSD
jgi:hypothetical protein